MYSFTLEETFERLITMQQTYFRIGHFKGGTRIYHALEKYKNYALL